MNVTQEQRAFCDHHAMRVNARVAVRWFTETTGPFVFFGICWLLVGLGIGDQSIRRQFFGFAGALMLAFVTWRPIASINLARSSADRCSD